MSNRPYTTAGRKIVLKPVGKSSAIMNGLSLFKKTSVDVERKKDDYTNEINPSEKGFGRTNTFLRTAKKKDLKFNFIEDPRQSAFSHGKFILLEKIIFLITVFSLFLLMIKNELDLMPSPKSSEYSSSLVLVLSTATGALVIVLFLRAICLNELEIDQKKFYFIRKERGFWSDLSRFCIQKSAVRCFLIEVIINLPHPIYFFENKTVQMFQAYDQIYIKHSINDILALISLTRVYLLFRSLVNLTIYSSPRAARLCSHNGIKHNFLYSVKCLLKQQPLRTISIAFIILIFTLGFGVKLSEGSLTKTMPTLKETGFENLINCYWCIFITMTTIGYGDYYPKTFLGRTVIFITAISGVILSSLLIVSLSAYLTMQPNESKSHLTLKRLQYQQKLKTEATSALIQTMKITKHLSSQNKDDSTKIKSYFTELKSKIDRVKFRNRQIKSMVNNNNIMEEMSRLFELFKDSLQDSFKNQLKLKNELEELDKTSNRIGKAQTLILTQNMQEIISQKI